MIKIPISYFLALKIFRPLEVHKLNPHHHHRRPKQLIKQLEKNRLVLNLLVPPELYKRNYKSIRKVVQVSVNRQLFVYIRTFHVKSPIHKHVCQLFVYPIFVYNLQVMAPIILPLLPLILLLKIQNWKIMIIKIMQKSTEKNPDPLQNYFYQPKKIKLKQVKSMP